MTKILFLIHDLGDGGAEKVLVNLVNNMDVSKFDITVMSIFDEGINRQFLSDRIHYKYCFKKMFSGNSHLMKLMSPEKLHKMLIKEKYDIEVSYLEGPCARIISGCPYEETKLITWIHIEQHTEKRAAVGFRTIEEAKNCYQKFHQIICVSESVKNDFQNIFSVKNNICVLYNTNETKQIIIWSKEEVTENQFSENKMNIVGVGKLLKSKGFDRILRIVKKLQNEDIDIHFYILGKGPEKEALENYVMINDLKKNVSFLGYQINPYKYVAKADLFVCASWAEGFSTAATEALIVGTPVCTVEVSGMKEMLGENNEYGIVTDNNEEALYQGIKQLLDNPELLRHYKNMASERGKMFSTENTVKSVENMLLGLLRK